jgi:hypothetical protein
VARDAALQPSSSTTRAHSRAAYSIVAASVWWLSRRADQYSISIARSK